MKNLVFVRELCLSVVLIVCPTALAAQSAVDSLRIRNDRVGRVIIGMTIDSLYRAVGRERTHLIDRFREGLFDPAIEIRLGSPASTPTMLVEVDFSHCGARVGRIEVRDPRYRTENGLHVGSTLAEVRRQHNVQVSNEEGLRAYSAALPFTFELENDRPTGRVTAIALFRGDRPRGCP